MNLSQHKKSLKNEFMIRKLQNKTLNLQILIVNFFLFIFLQNMIFFNLFSKTNKNTDLKKN